MTQQPQPIPASAVRAGDRVAVRTSFEGVVTIVHRDSFTMADDDGRLNVIPFAPEAGKQSVSLIEKAPDADLLDRIVSEIGKGGPKVVDGVDVHQVARAALKAVRDHEAAQKAAASITGQLSSLTVTTSPGAGQ